jgi:DNA-binding MarR family transcriptional regulator
MSSFSSKKSRKAASLAAGGPLAAAVNPLSLDAQLCFLLYSSTHAMVKVYKPVLDRLGLTYPQYLVMLLLWERDGWTVNALGDRLGLDSGTLTPLLRRMDAKGLVQRTRDAEDERRVRVGLSAGGQALKAQAGVVPEAMRCALGLDDAELLTLRATLADLNRRLSQSAG